MESQERRWSFFDSDVFHTVYNSYRGKLGGGSCVYYALLYAGVWVTRLLHSWDRGRRRRGNDCSNWRKDFEQDRTSMSCREATYVTY